MALVSCCTLVQCVFDSVVESNDFEVLYSTRHFGTLVFYLALNGDIPPLLNYFGGCGRISDCADIVRLQKTLYPNWRFAINSADTDLKVVTDFIKQNPRLRDQLKDLNTFLKEGVVSSSKSRDQFAEQKKLVTRSKKTTVDASNISTAVGPLGDLSREYDVQLLKAGMDLDSDTALERRKIRSERSRQQLPKQQRSDPED